MVSARGRPVTVPIGLADRQAVMDSFSRLAASQQFAMEYLYARLFAAHPELRALDRKSVV